MMREPNGLMMIMVLCTRVSHPRQMRPGRTPKRVEKGTRIVRSKVPADFFDPVDLHRNAVIGKRNNLNAFQLEALLTVPSRDESKKGDKDRTAEPIHPAS